VKEQLDGDERKGAFLLIFFLLLKVDFGVGMSCRHQPDLLNHMNLKTALLFILSFTSIYSHFSLSLLESVRYQLTCDYNQLKLNHINSFLFIVYCVL
jgi:hypothetical protein